MTTAYLKGLEENPMPDYIKELGLLHSITKEGYRSLWIINVDGAKLDDAMSYSYEHMISYFLDVPGFNFQVDLCIGMEAGIKMFKRTKGAK